MTLELRVRLQTTTYIAPAWTVTSKVLVSHAICQTDFVREPTVCRLACDTTSALKMVPTIPLATLLRNLSRPCGCHELYLPITGTSHWDLLRVTAQSFGRSAHVVWCVQALFTQGRDVVLSPTPLYNRRLTMAASCLHTRISTQKLQESDNPSDCECRRNVGIALKLHS